MAQVSLGTPTYIREPKTKKEPIVLPPITAVKKSSSKKSSSKKSSSSLIPGVGIPSLGAASLIPAKPEKISLLNPEVLTSPITTIGLAVGLGGVAVGGLVGVAALTKIGLGIGFSIASGSGIMTWLASDNILSSMSIFTRDLREAVTYGSISQTEAQLELDKAQGFVNEAKKFVETNTLLNPLLWPFRGIVLTNVDAAQNSIDFNKKIIATITPIEPAKNSSQEETDWEEIQRKNRERELAEREEDEKYFQRIKEEALEDKAAQRAEEEAYWARINAENAARKASEKAAEEAYWAKIREDNAAREEAKRAADEAYWAKIKGDTVTTPEGTTTTQTIEAGETTETTPTEGTPEAPAQGQQTPTQETTTPTAPEPETVEYTSEGYTAEFNKLDQLYKTTGNNAEAKAQYEKVKTYGQELNKTRNK